MAFLYSSGGSANTAGLPMSGLIIPDIPHDNLLGFYILGSGVDSDPLLNLSGGASLSAIGNPVAYSDYSVVAADAGYDTGIPESDEMTFAVLTPWIDSGVSTYIIAGDVTTTSPSTVTMWAFNDTIRIAARDGTDATQQANINPRAGEAGGWGVIVGSVSDSELVVTAGQSLATLQTSSAAITGRTHDGLPIRIGASQLTGGFTAQSCQVAVVAIYSGMPDHKDVSQSLLAWAGVAL